jgi:hypothetical protein
LIFGISCKAGAFARPGAAGAPLGPLAPPG